MLSAQHFVDSAGGTFQFVHPFGLMRRRTLSGSDVKRSDPAMNIVQRRILVNDVE